MRLLIRVLIGLIVGVLLIVLCMPPLLGIVLQYDSHLVFSDSSNYFSIQILKYHRGWFSSDVTFKIKETPELRSKLQMFSSQTENLTSDEDYMIKGHLQHGPIFYSPVPNTPRLGLALMTHQLLPTEQQRHFFSLFGINLDNIKNNTSYLSFTGKYEDFFELHNLSFETTEGIRVKLDSLEANIGSYNNNIEGKIKLNGFSLGDDNTLIFLPNTRIQFDLQKKHELWLGNQTLSISKIEMMDAGEKVQISDIELNGGIGEKAGLINGEKQLNIGNIKFHDQVMGPMRLQLSVHNLNSKVISDLIGTYQEIAANGEMYEFQLRQKIISLLPSIIGPDSELSLDQLNVKTSDGSLLMNAKAYWPAENFSPQMKIQDLAETASLTAGFNVSVPLAHKIINVLSKFVYTYQIPNEERQQLIELQNAIRLSTQLNAYNILELIDKGAIPKEDGIDLLTKIRNNISLEDYLEEVKKLLWLRKIDLPISYGLIFLYTMLYQHYNEFDHRVAIQQQNTEQMIRNQLNQYLKTGFIIQKDNQYIMSLSREKSQFIVNGKLRN